MRVLRAKSFPRRWIFECARASRKQEIWERTPRVTDDYVCDHVITTTKQGHNRMQERTRSLPSSSDRDDQPYRFVVGKTANKLHQEFRHGLVICRCSNVLEFGFSITTWEDADAFRNGPESQFVVR